MNAYRAGNVTIANAVGTGVGDDKAVYRYVPEMIRFYLDEEPILANVPTYDCTNDAERRHVIANLERLVVKNTNASGGYGMLMGPSASREERERFRDSIEANPRDFIAQPVVQISSSPTLVDGGMVAPRTSTFARSRSTAARSTSRPPRSRAWRCAEGSLVVNSSQGGGSKDTWVLQG